MSPKRRYSLPPIRMMTVRASTDSMTGQTVSATPRGGRGYSRGTMWEWKSMVPTLLHPLSAVDADHLSCDEPGFITCQVRRERGNFVHFAEASHRNLPGHSPNVDDLMLLVHGAFRVQHLSDLIREDASRRNRVHGDAVLRKFACQPGSESIHAALRCVIARVRIESRTHRISADIDDPAGLTPDHGWEYGAAAPDHSPEVAIYRRVQRLRRMFKERPDHAPSGVVKQDIDAAPPVNGSGDCRRSAFLVTQILRDPRDLGRTGRFHRVCNGRKCICVHVD